MSSTTRSMAAVYCYVCKDVETRTKPLLKCSRCSLRYHPCCHTPELSETDVSFTCQRCRRKLVNNIASTRLSESSLSAPLGSAMGPPTNVQSGSSLAKCDRPKCRNIPSSSPVDGFTFCVQHSMDYKYSKAKPIPVKNTAPPSKPINKDKLYKIRPEDGLFTNKRKRGSASSRTHLSSHGMGSSKHTSDFRTPGAARKSTTVRGPISEKGHGRIAASMQASVSSRSPPDARHHMLIEGNFSAQAEQKTRRLTADVSMLPESSVFDREEVSGFANPIEESPGFRTSANPCHNNPIPWLDEEQQDNNTEMNRDEQAQVSMASNGGRNNMETLPLNLNGLVKQLPQISSKSPYTFSPGGFRISPSAGGLQSFAVPSAVPLNVDRARNNHGPTENVPNSKSNSEPVVRDHALPQQDVSVTNDKDFIDPVPLEAESGSYEGLKDFADPRAHERDAAARNASDELDVTRRVKGINKYSFDKPTPHAEPIVARIRPNENEPKELERWIKKQQDFDPDYHPSEKELLESQLWGHIDPRVYWPKQHSEEWNVAKQKEIAARPTRKQRFGKVRTLPLVNSEPIDEDECKAAERFCEELFGIENQNDFKLEVNEGVLCAVEQNNTVDPGVKEQRKKRKSDLRVFRVGG